MRFRSSRRRIANMKLDLEALATWIRRAETDELLDRATVFRPEMEPEAVQLILAELARRGLSHEKIDGHAAMRKERAVARADGSVARCRFCGRPAAAVVWKWWRLFRIVPLFPLKTPVCERHE